MNNLLENYVADVLKANGFENLSEENKKIFLPQFTAEAEKRIGLAILPLLTVETAKELEAMSKKETTPEEWWTFCSANIPNFITVVGDTLKQYAEEVKEVLQKK